MASGVHWRGRMKFACILVAACAGALSAQEKPPPVEPPAQEPAVEENINERYTVESATISGVKESRLSQGLRDDLQKMVGQRFSQKTLDGLTDRMRDELEGRRVTQKVSRGDKPEHVKVELVVGKRQIEPLDITLSKLLYHSKSAWSAKLVGDFMIEEPASIIFGFVSDADDLLERYAGINAGFHVRQVVTDRLRLKFLFETYHQQWNRTTLLALDQAGDSVPGIYRTRRNIAPTLSLALARPLTLSVGTNFQFIETQFPTTRTETAHAALGALRYRQRFVGTGGARHQLEAAYNIRAATRTFESDFVYTRHNWEFGYKLSGRRRQSILTVFTAGRLNGRAPLFERFTLGNSTTLRGWSKFDVAPLGATRMAHNTLEYRLGSFQAFYDAGAVWDRGDSAVVKHAFGFGVREDTGPARLVMPGFFATVGFPIKRGRMAPMFMIGINF